MIKLLIVSPYYNNSHFIDLQILSFRRNLKNCQWKFVVVDDSNEDTINLLTKTKENILEKCKKYPDEIDYVKFEKSDKNKPGNLKHLDVLNFIIQEVSQTYKNDYDYLLSLDADMCFIKNFYCHSELDGYDIIGPKRIQSLNRNQLCEGCLVFDYFWVHLCFFNLKTITNISSMSLNFIPNTTCDTGSMMLEFLTNNPQYKLKYLPFSDGTAIKGFYRFETFYNNTILHFYTGSLWNTYKEHEYLELFNIFRDKVINGLTNKDEQIIEEEKIKHIYPEYIRFFQRNKVSINDLKQFGLNITV
jgi:hypothetical protein